MGKKGKKNFDDDEGFAQADHSVGFVSHKQALAKEAKEAEKGNPNKGKKNQQHESDSDEEKAGKNKRSRKAQQADADFEEAKQNKDDGGDMEAEFEGIAKKNTRKKKQKETNIFATDGMDVMGAFDEGADSDEVHAKKGGKNHNKKERQQGKKKNKKQQESDQDEEEETKVAAEEAPEEKPAAQSGSDDEEESGYPLNVVYCQHCGIPPEYCSFGHNAKDLGGCKEWLQNNHPLLFKEVYGVEAEPTGESDAKKAEGGENGEEAQDGEGKKEKKKVKFGKKTDGIVRVIKLKRGGKKVICQITGLEHYTNDLKALASKFGKKFSCGAAVAQDDIYGECVSVQGDVEDRLLDILETDKEMAALNIPIEKIEFEDKGNKKGRKKN